MSFNEFASIFWMFQIIGLPRRLQIFMLVRRLFVQGFPLGWSLLRISFRNFRIPWLSPFKAAWPKFRFHEAWQREASPLHLQEHNRQWESIELLHWLWAKLYKNRLGYKLGHQKLFGFSLVSQLVKRCLPRMLYQDATVDEHGMGWQGGWK